MVPTRVPNGAGAADLYRSGDECLTFYVGELT